MKFVKHVVAVLLESIQRAYATYKNQGGWFQSSWNKNFPYPSMLGNYHLAILYQTGKLRRSCIAFCYKLHDSY
jgi:hypothetical protein